MTSCIYLRFVTPSKLPPREFGLNLGDSSNFSARGVEVSYLLSESSVKFLLRSLKLGLPTHRQLPALGAACFPPNSAL